MGRNRVMRKWAAFLLCLMLCVQNMSFIGVSTANADESPADVSSYFHATVSTSDGGSEYVSESTVTFLIKYKLDYGVINEGDYVYLTVPSALSVGRLSVDPTHFSSASLDHTDSNGNQVYKLVFTAAANEGISGSITLRVTANNTGTDTIAPVVEIGNDSASIFVIPGGTSPSGQESRAIEKDALGSDGTGMSTGWNSSEGGYSIYDPDKGAVTQYRVYVNLKHAYMEDVIVTDYLPAGLTFDDSITYCWTETDQSDVDLTADELAQINFSNDKNKLTWTFGSLLTNRRQLLIEYKAIVPAGTAATYHNVAVINYTEDGASKTESASRNIYPESNASASLGVKSVDKTVISSDPSDQYVEYTFTFKTHANASYTMVPFAVGEINFDDKLDSNVQFDHVSNCDDSLTAVYDNTTHKVHIENTKEISDSSEHQVSFVVNFTKAPAGTTVTNTVGGNTVKTKKYGGGLTLSSKKTLDGKAPGTQVFSFQLLDSSGKILQTKQNDEKGNIYFDQISYSKDDIGKKYQYTVKEISGTDESINYDATIYNVTVIPSDTDDDGNITATPTITKTDGSAAAAIEFNNTSHTTSVTVTKAWDDNGNQDGTRPEHVTVKLLADGKDTGKTLTLNAADSWTGSFSGLAEKSGGKTVAYTVVEDAVEGYTAAVTGDATKGYTVTNSHSPETTTVAGGKTWDDRDNQDGARPEKITVRLLADGTEKASKDVTAADGWKWSFDNLPKYAAGKEISYTVTEDAVAGYQSVVSDYNITNTHTPGQTSVTVTKAWSDGDNQDGTRPDHVTVKLLADGKETGKTLTLNAADSWTGSFSGLDERSGGKTVAYTVVEDAVEGYTAAVTGNATKGYTITNTASQHTPVPNPSEKVTVHKTWNGSGTHPEKVTFRLFAVFDDGTETEIGDKQAGAFDNWTAGWTEKEIASTSEASPSDASKSDADEEILADGEVGNDLVLDNASGKKITGFYVREINIPDNWSVSYGNPATSSDADGTEEISFEVTNTYKTNNQKHDHSSGGGGGAGTVTVNHPSIPLGNIPQETTQSGPGEMIIPEIEVALGDLPKEGEGGNAAVLPALLSGILLGLGLVLKSIRKKAE